MSVLILVKYRIFVGRMHIANLETIHQYVDVTRVMMEIQL